MAPEHSILKRVAGLARLALFTSAAQIAIQAIGFVCGILIVRLLPLNEYAIYTLANSLLGAMSILADGGLSNGVMAEGGKVWQKKAKLKAVLDVGFRLQKRQNRISFLLVTPPLLYLLHRQNVSGLMSLLVVVSLVPAFVSVMAGSLLQIPLKLHQDIKILQRYQLEGNLVRAFLSGLIVFIFPFASLAILCSSIAQLWSNKRIEKRAELYCQKSADVESYSEDAILTIIKRTMPLAIFYMITGQMTLWLMSISGQIESIAHQGAISRYFAIVTLIGTIYNALIVPRFSRTAGKTSKLLLNYTAIHVSLLSFFALTVVFTQLLARPALALLGHDYKDLDQELILAMTGAMLSIMTDIGFSTNASRGYVYAPKFYIPLMLSVIIALIYFFSYETLTAALLINVYFRACSYIFTLLYGVYRLKKGN